MFESSRMKDAHLIEAYEILVPPNKNSIESLKNDNPTFKMKCSISNKESST